MYEDEIPVNKAENLIGKTFGKLTVLYRVKNPYGRKDAYWKCKCSCGNYHIVMGGNLKRNKVQSCGCLSHSKEKNEQRSKTMRNKPKYEMLNKKFGLLTVIKELEQDNRGEFKYLCECECGNFTTVLGGNLRSGHTSSCGCVKSKGNKTISSILSENNIKFTTEKTFKDLKFIGNLRFDFFINNEYCLEFDGIQHYTGWANNKDNLLYNQKRDEIKNQWCKDNNIPLIRIPYTKLDTLCIEDLLLETTQFRVI
jgi:hypothetical protein